MAREKQSFSTIEPNRVKMYVCGPTVYDYIHIGNARPLVFFDVVRRYLQFAGYEVSYVVNFTDVDDKLIRKAEQLSCTVPEVAATFIQAFYEDLEQLGVHKADANPRVTENMAEIIAMIADLVKQGFAYERDGDVYFRTTRFSEYGKLSQQNIEDLQYGIRIEVDERKQHPADFVLWKRAKQGEIFWSSPWGDGRPGWHIECSAMVKKYLGTTIDIHGGGHDLTFPHHECEIAQSEAHTGQTLANYWMHNGYIHINNEKMSKSLGNSILVRDLMTQLDVSTMRYFILSTHYRNPLNFTDDAMNQAQKSVERIQNAAHNVQHLLQTMGSQETIPSHEHSSSTANPASSELQQQLARIEAFFHEKMCDDFNTADAITAMFEWVSVANIYLQRTNYEIADLVTLQSTFDKLNNVLGLYRQTTETLLDEEIERLIMERTDARKTKQWVRADEIRDLLTAKGIVLEDTAQGVRWKRL
jgi:cysteinyl-tRNA synthetase